MLAATTGLRLLGSRDAMPRHAGPPLVVPRRVTALAAMASELASGYVTIGRMACGFTARFLPSKKRFPGPRFALFIRRPSQPLPFGVLSILAQRRVHNSTRTAPTGRVPNSCIMPTKEVRLQRTLLANDVVCEKLDTVLLLPSSAPFPPRLSFEATSPLGGAGQSHQAGSCEGNLSADGRPLKEQVGAP